MLIQPLHVSCALIHERYQPVKAKVRGCVRPVATAGSTNGCQVEARFTFIQTTVAFVLLSDTCTPFCSDLDASREWNNLEAGTTVATIQDTRVVHS